MVTKDADAFAFDLALALWSGIPLEYKRGYMNIWSQFEGWLYTAAMQNSSLAEFVGQVVRNSGGTIGKNAAQYKEASIAIGSGLDREILDIFRKRAAIMALRVRVERQREHELYEEIE